MSELSEIDPCRATVLKFQITMLSAESARRWLPGGRMVAQTLSSCHTWQALGDQEAGAVAHAVQEGVVLQQRCAAGGPVQEAVEEGDRCDGSHVPLQASQHHQLHVFDVPRLKGPLPGRRHLYLQVSLKELGQHGSSHI